MFHRRALIYDVSDNVLRQVAKRNDDPGTVLVPVEPPSFKEHKTGTMVLREKLVELVKQGSTFNSLVFVTHGASGIIGFGIWSVTAMEMKTYLGNNGLEKLLLPGGRVYFAGCNVAADEDGWAFLEAAASTFLSGSWGTVLGWTSYGIAFNHNLGILPDNITHFWGTTRYVMIDPGSKSFQRKDSLQIEHEVNDEIRRMKELRESGIPD